MLYLTMTLYIMQLHILYNNATLSVQQYIAIANLYLILNLMADKGFHWSPSFVGLDAGVSVSISVLLIS